VAEVAVMARSVALGVNMTAEVDLEKEVRSSVVAPDGATGAQPPKKSIPRSLQIQLMVWMAKSQLILRILQLTVKKRLTPMHLRHPKRRSRITR
jgi:hypothetical protein